MKKIIKKITSLIVVCLLIALSGCEKDLYENNIHQQSRKFSYLKGKQALDVTKLLAEKMDKNKTITNRGLELVDYGTVKYDVVMEVIDNEGNISYTFRVDHPEATYKKFYNMVLQQKIDGLTMVKFYEYNMTPEFAEKYNRGEKKIKDFQGTYNYRLASYSYASGEGSDGEGGGGGGSGDGGGYNGGGNNDGNTGSPTGGSNYDPTGHNTSSGVGSLGSGSSGGSPCPGGGGGIGSGGDGGGGSGGPGGGGSGGGSGGTGSSSNCTTTTITVLCNGGGGHTGESTCNGTNHGYTIQITICNGGSNRGINDANPCGGSGGGSGGNSSGTGILEPILVQPTPCDQMKKLGDPTKNNIKPNVDLLKLKVNSSNNKSEIGFETKKNLNADETITYVNNNITSGNQFNVSLTTGGNNIGGGHSHPVGSYPMFSYGDVKWLRDA